MRGVLKISYFVVPWSATFNFDYFYELEGEDRIRGESIGINFVVDF